MRRYLGSLVFALTLAIATWPAFANGDYLLLATNRTSTMQKELDAAAAAGHRFQAAMGGETSYGGQETVIVMRRDPESRPGRFQYRLLATSRTSTMQRELQQAGREGFEYRAQTVFETSFRGNEVVVILERDTEQHGTAWEYELLATRKTSTMQKELNESAARGFQLVGLTVGETAFGGQELVCILQRPR